MHSDKSQIKLCRHTKIEEAPNESKSPSDDRAVSLKVVPLRRPSLSFGEKMSSIESERPV